MRPYPRLRHALIVVLLLAVGHVGTPRFARGQSLAADSVTRTLSSLFDSMHTADSAGVRRAFLDGARVVPVSDLSKDATVGGLTIDAFASFVANTAANPWIEHMQNVDVRVSGGVAVAWFDYDVHRGSTFSHCGVNAVTLRRTADGWKIVTMAFTNAQAKCAPGVTPR